MNDRIKCMLEDLHQEYDTLDPFVLIESSGIEIRYVDFGENPLGQYIKLFDCPTILLNQSIENSPQKYFVASHELHHALEHEDLSGYYVFNHKSRAKLENEANIFATTLLFNFYIEENAVVPETSSLLEKSYGVPSDYSELFLKI